MKRTVYSSYLADKWNKLGYKIVALSNWNNEATALAYHLEKTLKFFHVTVNLAPMRYTLLMFIASPLYQ